MIPLPAEVRRLVQDKLPEPSVLVIPRDARLSRCSAYQAEFYEIAVYYADMRHPLVTVETDLRYNVHPSIEQTTRIDAFGIFNPAWRIHYRDLESMRPQVRALMRLSRWT